MYIVRSDRGSFIIRKVNADPKRIEFCHCIKGLIRRKGCQLTDMLEPAADGRPFAEVDGTCYIMTAARRELINPDYTKTQDVKEIIKTFACIHKTAVFGSCEEFRDFRGRDAREYFRCLEKRFLRLKRFLLRKRRLDDIDYIFIKNFEYFYRLCEESLEGLEICGYRQEEARAASDGKIALNNADEEAMYITPHGIIMTDLLNLSLSTQLEDLRLLINRYLKKCPEPELDICSVIKIYTSINPLTEKQLNLLRHMLLFPERYITTYSDYYKKGHVFTPVSVKESIKKIINEKETHESYISKLIP